MSPHNPEPPAESQHGVPYGTTRASTIARFTRTQVILTCGITVVVGIVAGVGLGLNINPADAREKGIAEGMEIGKNVGYAQGSIEGYARGLKTGKDEATRQFTAQIRELQNDAEERLRTSSEMDERACKTRLARLQGELLEEHEQIIEDMTTQGEKAVARARSEGEAIAIAKGGYPEGFAAGEAVGEKTAYRRGVNDGKKEVSETARDLGYRQGLNDGQREGREACADDLAAKQLEIDNMSASTSESTRQRRIALGAEHQAGYKEGFTAGRDAGYKDGYREGVKVGTARGRKSGW